MSAGGPAPDRPADSEQPPGNLAAVIEALLLVAEEPPTIAALARASNSPADAVEAALDEINADRSRGIRVRRHADSAALVSAPEAAPYIERLLALETPNRLSRAALETLAIIAYRQPLTRTQIEAVRGVGADGALRTLRARGLIEPVGRADGQGQPLLWGVTSGFLDHFALGAVTELPPIEGLGPAAQQAELGLAGPDPGRQAALPDAPE